MKKLFTFLSVIALTLCGVLPANAQWNRYFVNENFDEITSLPSTLTYYSGASNNASKAFIGRNGGQAIKNGAINLTGSGGGSRGGELSLITTLSKEKLNVEFDWKVTSAALGPKNSAGFYFLGSQSVWESYNDVVLGVYMTGSSGKVHVWNKDIVGPFKGVGGSDSTVVVWDLYQSFRRAGADAATVDSRNESTATTVTYAAGSTYHILAEIDYTSHKINLTITDKSNAENTQTLSDIPFVSNKVADFSRIGVINSRSSNEGNGLTVGYDMSIDNLNVYEVVPSLGKTDITIKYQDLEGGKIKDDLVIPQQEIGVAYVLTSSDKASFPNGGFYYAYDPVATGTDTLIVSNEAKEIIAKFVKNPVTAGSYVWNGSVSNVWNEYENNFQVGSAVLPYQTQNEVEFSATEIQNDSVLVNQAIDLGDKNVTISASGYTLSGTGQLKGTGALVIKADSRINLINNLDGGVELNQGTLTIDHADAAKSIIAVSGTSLEFNGSFSKPISGFGGTLSILATAKTDFAQTLTSTITGLDKVVYTLRNKGRVAYSSTTATVPNCDRMLEVNNVYTGSVDVVNALSETAYFKTTVVDWTATKLHLGDNVRMIYGTTGVATKDEATATTFTIGELSGSETSRLVGGYVDARKTKYKIGSLNTDATFSGVIAPLTITRESSDRYLSKPHLSIYKEGTGTWTLTNNSPDYRGNLFVNDGTLIINGIICSQDSIVNLETVQVEAAGHLSGTGTIYAVSANVYGKLSGNLTFGGAANLWATSETDIVVNGATADKVTVAGDLQYGGKLVVTSKNNPPAGTYKIIQAASYLESSAELGFDEVVLPSTNWTFKWSTGELVYVGGDASGINNAENDKVVKSVEYFTVSGTKTLKDQKGFLIKVTKFTDGSSSTTKAVNK